MIRLSFVGDIACDGVLIKAARRGASYDFSRVFQTGNVFSDSDLVIGNLETYFSGKDFGNKLYQYWAPDSFCDAIKDAGFDIVGTANNHCMDGGVEGLKRTLKILDQRGISHTGTFADDREKRYLVVEINGIKIAFVSVAHNLNTCYDSSMCEDVSRYVNTLGFKKGNYSKNPLKRWWQTSFSIRLGRLKRKLQFGSTMPAFTDQLTPGRINPDWLSKIDALMERARSEADVLVALVHVGGQFNVEPGSFSQFVVEHLRQKGADVIAAHHPHCLQRMERLGDTYVAYSLGAFCISPSAAYLCKESLPEYGAAWHIDIDEETRSVKGTSVRILKSIEDKDHYVHVVEAEEDSPQVRQIRTRLGLDRAEQNA